MSVEKKPRSSSHERFICGYLRPGLQKKVSDYLEQTKMGKSEAINKGLKLLVDSHVPTKKIL